jgi:MFS transporter, PAT family, beta-lactamase induction signal transducer AmpG
MTADVSSNKLAASTTRGPWWWVPSLYFAQGLPYVVVMTVAVIMFKRLGVGNAQIALYTSWLYLPYAIKPLWSPLVQRIGTRRGWVLVMQLFVAIGLACTAMAIPLDSFLRWSLVALASVAICSATHDVAADGFYLLALSTHQQAWFVGIRSTAYRMAMIAGQGLLVMLAGSLESATGLPVVEVQVRAGDREATTPSFSPTEFAQVEGTSKQRVSVGKQLHEISVRGQKKNDVKSLKETVRKWNVEHSFYAAPESAAQKDKTKAKWVLRLENFLRRHFGANRDAAAQTSDRTGDVAVVIMRLTQPVPPGEQQVVQFGRAAGDSNFDVVEGERFTVVSANWQEPFAAVVQVDAKLERPSEATFVVRSGNLRLAWSVTFFFVAGVFLAFCIYHYVALPHSAADIAATTSTAAAAGGITGFLVPFVDFFRKPRIFAILAFLLLYRFPESQLVKLTTPFMLDPREVGGLALTTAEVGVIYGTVGVIMLTVGGIIGGFAVARGGLGRWLWPMALAIHLPNLAFLFLAYAQPESRPVITAAVAVEQFGYGFGFTAYMLYCVYVATGKHQTVHYALCTGCMALGMMIPGMWSGWLQEIIGYRHFFAWIMLAMIPSLLAVAFIQFDPDFGKKRETTTVGK